LGAKHGHASVDHGTRLPAFSNLPAPGAKPGGEQKKISDSRGAGGVFGDLNKMEEQLIDD